MTGPTPLPFTRGEAYLVDVGGADPVRLSLPLDDTGSDVRSVGLSRDDRFASFSSPNETFLDVAGFDDYGSRVWRIDLEAGSPPTAPSSFCQPEVAVGDTGQISNVSLGAEGTLAWDAAAPAMSSLSSLAGTGDLQVYARDPGPPPSLDLISRVSGIPSPSGGRSQYPSVGVRANGDVVVAFTSTADPLGLDDTPERAHAYVKNLTTGSLQLIDHVLGAPLDLGVFGSPAISADGNIVAFLSQSPELHDPGMTGMHVYVWDAGLDVMELAAPTAPDRPANPAHAHLALGQRTARRLSDAGVERLLGGRRRRRGGRRHLGLRHRHPDRLPRR